VNPILVSLLFGVLATAAEKSFSDCSWPQAMKQGAWTAGLILVLLAVLEL